MMMTAALAMVVMAPVVPGVMAAGATVCPVMGSPVTDTKTAGFLDYNGARFYFCCPGCDVKFAKEPAKYVTTQAKAKKAAGELMFDPVSGMRLKPGKMIAEDSVFEGVQFRFESAANKAAFDKDPKAYGMMPKKEALFCPVMGHAVKDYASAASYKDYEGVRYYTCCGGCVSKLNTNPAEYVASAKNHVKTPGIATGAR